jgi:hypothetical protein
MKSPKIFPTHQHPDISITSKSPQGNLRSFYLSQHFKNIFHNVRQGHLRNHPPGPPHLRYHTAPASTSLVPQPLPIVSLNDTRLHNTASGGLQKRDLCGSGYPYTDSDMSALINSLQSDGQSDYLKAQSSRSWSLGTARVCIYNQYLFENTHVSHGEMGWGAAYIAGKCCFNGNPRW